MKFIFEITSLSELDAPANKIISLFPEYNLFIFKGEIGSGKTTLISKICQKIDVEKTNSPSFSIVNTYYSKKYGEIFHFDLYRIIDENEAIESGLETLINSGNICFVEWGEKIHNLLPKNLVSVFIKTNHNFRKIIVST